MKAFDGESYYDILKIPVDAGFQQIQRAYREVRDIYQEDSLVTYTLFSDEQRSEILRLIDTAYRTLSDKNRRRAYDLELNGNERIPAASINRQVAESDDSVIAEGPDAGSTDLGTWVKNRLKEEKIARMADDVVAKEFISGSDLKELREAMDIKLSDIYQATRISGTTLTMIEENQFDQLPADVFLKSFLKSYAEILQIDSHRVIDGYYRNRSLS